MDIYNTLYVKVCRHSTPEATTHQKHSVSFKKMTFLCSVIDLPNCFLKLVYREKIEKTEKRKNGKTIIEIYTVVLL